MDQAKQFDWETPGPGLSFALNALSARQRAVVHLTYWEDLTGPEFGTTVVLANPNPSSFETTEGDADQLTRSS